MRMSRSEKWLGAMRAHRTKESSWACALQRAPPQEHSPGIPSTAQAQVCCNPPPSPLAVVCFSQCGFGELLKSDTIARKMVLQFELNRYYPASAVSQRWGWAPHMICDWLN